MTNSRGISTGISLLPVSCSCCLLESPKAFPGVGSSCVASLACFLRKRWSLGVGASLVASPGPRASSCEPVPLFAWDLRVSDLFLWENGYMSSLSPKFSKNALSESLRMSSWPCVWILSGLIISASRQSLRLGARSPTILILELGVQGSLAASAVAGSAQTSLGLVEVELQVVDVRVDFVHQRFFVVGQIIALLETVIGHLFIS